MECKHVCAACGKEVENTTTVCSAFGAFSFGVCDECLIECREPYGMMLCEIAWTVEGEFPKGINEIYQKEVLRQLKLHGKTVEQFNEDIKETHAEWEQSQIPDGSDDKYDDFEGDFF